MMRWFNWFGLLWSRFVGFILYLVVCKWGDHTHAISVKYNLPFQPKNLVQTYRKIDFFIIFQNSLFTKFTRVFQFLQVGLQQANQPIAFALQVCSNLLSLSFLKVVCHFWQILRRSSPTSKTLSMREKISSLALSWNYLLFHKFLYFLQILFSLCMCGGRCSIWLTECTYPAYTEKLSL